MKRPASRRQSEIAHQQVSDLKHCDQTTPNDVSDIPCQKTPNDVRDIEPHPDLAKWFSSRLWLALVSRSVGVFSCGWLSPVWCFLSLVSLFWGLSPRPFSRFGAFLFLRVCRPGPVFSIGSEPDSSDGLNKFSPYWTKMV